MGCKSYINQQVVDDDKGPSTKREYEIARVPAGEALAGKVVDFLGRAPGSQVQLGTSVMVPLFGEQPDMEAREQIAEALLTGVKVSTATLSPYLCAAPVGKSSARARTGSALGWCNPQLLPFSPAAAKANVPGEVTGGSCMRKI